MAARAAEQMTAKGVHRKTVSFSACSDGDESRELIHKLLRAAGDAQTILRCTNSCGLLEMHRAILYPRPLHIFLQLRQLSAFVIPGYSNLFAPRGISCQNSQRSSPNRLLSWKRLPPRSSAAHRMSFEPVRPPRKTQNNCSAQPTTPWAHMIPHPLGKAIQ